MLEGNHPSQGLFLKDLHSYYSLDNGKVGATDVYLLHPYYQVRCDFVDLGQLIIPEVLLRQWRIHINKNSYSSKYVWDVQKSVLRTNYTQEGIFCL